MIICGKQMIDTVITKNPDSGVQCLLVSLSSITCSCETLSDLRLQSPNLCNNYSLTLVAASQGTVGVARAHQWALHSLGGGAVQCLVTEASSGHHASLQTRSSGAAHGTLQGLGDVVFWVCHSHSELSTQGRWKGRPSGK